MAGCLLDNSQLLSAVKLLAYQANEQSVGQLLLSGEKQEYHYFFAYNSAFLAKAAHGGLL